MNIIALTKRGRDTPNYFVYEGSAGGVLLTYIDRQVVPDDPVPELVTVEVTFHGPAVAAFRDFLADSIEVHDSGRDHDRRHLGGLGSTLGGSTTGTT